MLDDVLRLIDFIPLGPRYNSSILNLLINLLKKVLHPTKRQIVIATVSNAKAFEELGLLKYFQHTYSMERLRNDEISGVLHQNLGFDVAAGNSIGNDVQWSSIQELIDITNITRNQGQNTTNKWLEYWNSSRNR